MQFEQNWQWIHGYNRLATIFVWLCIRTSVLGKLYSYIIHLHIFVTAGLFKSIKYYICLQILLYLLLQFMLSANLFLNLEHHFLSVNSIEILVHSFILQCGSQLGWKGICFPRHIKWRKPLQDENNWNVCTIFLNKADSSILHLKDVGYLLLNGKIYIIFYFTF